MTDANNTPTNPASPEASDNREPLRVILIGSPYAVTYGIRTLSDISYAKESEWSSPSPARKPGQVMRTLTRYILKQ